MRFEIYESKFARSSWHWRLRASNGRIMADSGEAYSTKQGARLSIHRLCRGILKLGHVPKIVMKEDA